MILRILIFPKGWMLRETWPAFKVIKVIKPRFHCRENAVAALGRASLQCSCVCSGFVYSCDIISSRWANHFQIQCSVTKYLLHNNKRSIFLYLIPTQVRTVVSINCIVIQEQNRFPFFWTFSELSVRRVLDQRPVDWYNSLSPAWPYRLTGAWYLPAPATQGDAPYWDTRYEMEGSTWTSNIKYVAMNSLISQSKLRK